MVMKKIILVTTVFAALLAMQSCVTQNHATTVERDKDDGCSIRLIVQLGIDGNDSDVIIAQENLDACFNRECLIPCSQDSTRGCKVKSNVIVKKWSTIPAKDTDNYHHITMVPQDDLPSFVNAIGTANAGHLGGTWRRDAHPFTYCHEVLHLCGLPDHYCSRILDTVHHVIKQDVKCQPGPDPRNDTCCDPHGWRGNRCSTPCTGHSTDLMATLSYGLSCQNILEIVSRAGLSDCPEECCKKPVYFNATNKHPMYPGLLQVGGGLGVGYTGFFMLDKNPTTGAKDHQTYNGFNTQLDAEVRYGLCEHGAIDGEFDFFDYDEEWDDFSYGGYSYWGGFEHMQLGLDVYGEYNPCHDTWIYGGPSLDFNARLKAGSGQTRNDITWQNYNALYPTGGYKVNPVNAGFVLGLKYEIPLGHKLYVDPFLQTRLPLSRTIGASSHPENFQNFNFNFSAGAKIMFGIK
jgi:hypothetical protein